MHKCLRISCVSSLRPQVSKHVCLSIPFINEATQKGSSKEHWLCIKEKQNILSQSFSCNLTRFCTPFRYLCSLGSAFQCFVFKRSDLLLLWSLLASNKHRCVREMLKSTSLLVKGHQLRKEFFLKIFVELLTLQENRAKCYRSTPIELNIWLG